MIPPLMVMAMVKNGTPAFMVMAMMKNGTPPLHDNAHGKEWYLLAPLAWAPSADSIK